MAVFVMVFLTAFAALFSPVQVFGRLVKEGNSSSGKKDASGDADAGEEGRGSAAFSVHLAGEPGDPVPARTMDLDTASLLGLISEGLTALDREGGVIPGCAKEWAVSDDGLKWSFTLREDLCWSDGEALGAEFFVSLFKKTADPMAETPYGQELVKNIAGYEAVRKGDSDALEVLAPDDHTLVIHLVSPRPGFARDLASLTLLPIRGESSGWESVTGNGPYRIASYDVGKAGTILLERNPYYHNDKRGIPLEKILWKVEGDRNQEYSDLLNGEIAATAFIPPEEKEDIRLQTEAALEERAIELSEQAISDAAGILFNCRQEFLSKKNVRRALCMVIDRGYIAEEILKDLYVPADGQCWFGGQSPAEASKSAGELPSGSLQEAKKLLEEAAGGYKELPSLTILADENGAVPEVAAYLADLWQDLGLKVSVKTVDAKKIVKKKAAGKYDVICGNLLLPSDLQAAELEKFLSKNEGNSTGFSDKGYDALMKEALQEKEEEKAEALMREAAGILARKVPVMPLVRRNVSWMNNQEKGTVFCDPSGQWQLWEKTAEDSDDRTTDRAADQKKDQSEEEKTGLNIGLKISQKLGLKTDRKEALSDDRTQDQEEDGMQDPAGTSGQTGSGSTLWPRGGADKEKSSGARSLFSRFFDAVRYFGKTDTEAWLTRQAYILKGTGENAERILSLPKYTQVHLTGTGNERYVRLTRSGLFQYLEADRVTTDHDELERLQREEEEEILWTEVVSQPLHRVKEKELALRAEEIREETEKILAKIGFREELRKQTRNPSWDGPVLSKRKGSVTGPSGKETYYNLDMTAVVNIMRKMGNTDEYWVRDDGCKMLGNYIMCAANLSVHPRGTLVETSLGTCIVCDTGGFAKRHPNQIDVAVTW